MKTRVFDDIKTRKSEKQFGNVAITVRCPIFWQITVQNVLVHTCKACFRFASIEDMEYYMIQYNKNNNNNNNNIIIVVNTSRCTLF